MSVSDLPPMADELKRKRSPSPPRNGARPHSPPHQRRRSASPPDLPRVHDVDPARRRERERQLALAALEAESSSKAVTKPDGGFDAAAEFAKLAAGSRTGGAYVPPARLRQMQLDASKDKASVEFQRLSWDALRKSINGHINKVNTSNIKHVVPELFAENLIRGRGLFCRSIMKAQAASLPYTPVFAALVAIINTKMPQVGELLVTRLASQFRRAFKRNDKTVCIATASFIAHLVNQSVAHELLALQILLLLQQNPTSDSLEIACALTREVGLFLTEHSAKAANMIFERFRAILHEGTVEKRVLFMIEVLFQVRKDRFKDNPSLVEELDLVEEDEQITHHVLLEDELQVQEGLNIFKQDPNFLENEDKYLQIKKEILGDSDDESGSDSGGSSGSESDDEDADDEGGAAVVPNAHGIKDMTETNMINFRRSVYLTIMNSLTYEEAVHKLLRLQVQEGMEIELCNMVIECCSQERSYSNFYGLIGERFCKINRVWCENFEQAFANYYETIHRYETNRLRNIGRFFGHLVATDAVSWGVFHVIKMNEEDTTSSSRIFIKILMTEMMESMGVKKIAERFAEPSMQGAFQNIFPLDNPRDTRFSINYFTSIGLGAVTERMREHLTNMPKIIMEQRQKALEAASSDSDSSSSSSSSSDSSSDSDSSSGSSRSRRSYSRSRSRSYSRSPVRRDTRRQSSTPPARRRRYSDSRSPPPVGRRERRRSSTPPVRRERSPSPLRRGGRSPAPVRSNRSPSPVRRGGRSPSPIRRGGRSPSPVRRGGRSPSPVRRGGRSPSPVRRGGGRSPSPVRRGGGRSPSPVRRGPPPGYGSGGGGGGPPGGYGGGPGYGGGRAYDSRPPPPHLQGGGGGGRGRSPSPVDVRRNEVYPDQRARPRADSRERERRY